MPSNNGSFNQINHVNHPSINTNHGNANVYNHSAINPSSFGGFSFGMTNNLNSVNFNSNQNFSFNRPQTPINREPISSMVSKTPNFDQSISNKCWSVGKIPTREPLNAYANQTQ